MVSAHLQQRFYPTLKLGLKAKVARGQREVALHCRQGGLDGACGVYCAAMALVLTGAMANLSALAHKRRGVAARLWEASHETYFEGMDSAQLATILAALDTGLEVDHCPGNHHKTLRFTQRWMEDGGLVIVSWRTRTWSEHHWVLVLGMEGMQAGRVFSPTTFLVMDPDAAEPLFCGYNGRLQFTSRPLPHNAAYIAYLDNSGHTRPVTLTGAVALRAAK